MRKSSNRIKQWSSRNYVLVAFVVVACLTLVYEVAIFCALNNKVINTTYSNKATSLAQADDISVSGSGSLDRIHADVVLHEFSGVHNYKIEDAGTEQVINSVHFVWCTTTTFNFINYLSVLSVLKILNPDLIEFHRKVPPRYDKYDDWLEELKKTVPNFAIKQVPPYWDGNNKGCGYWFGLAVIDERGGMYVNENVILNERIIPFRKKRISVVYNKFPNDVRSTIAVAMGNDHDDSFRSFRQYFSRTERAPDDAEFCQVLEPESVRTSHAPCFYINGLLSPKDVFELDTEFGGLARRLMYGSESFKKPGPILPGTIPKVVHYVWFGIKVMDFMMYLSMLSSLYIVNPEKVLVHTDGGLTGKYWDKLLKDKRIVVIKREIPTDIYGHKLLYVQHRSDIVRAECLLKYGGIYLDWDALWLKNPDDLLNTGYDAMANFDHLPQGKFPETINLGVIMAKPQSTFVKKWQDALINYITDDYLYNAVFLPYKVYEKYPEYLYIERRLQVMCFRLKCHPTFQKNFKNFTNEQPFDWRNDVYSIHFTNPDPKELTNEHICRNGDGRFAEIGRYILTYEKYLPR